jgi:hypothetical protein
VSIARRADPEAKKAAMIERGSASIPRPMVDAWPELNEGWMESACQSARGECRRAVLHDSSGPDLARRFVRRTGGLVVVLEDVVDKREPRDTV